MKSCYFLFRLKTGWSSRSSQLMNKSNSNSNVSNSNINSSDPNNNDKMNNLNKSPNYISDSEYLEIEQVMQRASLIEQKENERVKYVDDLIPFFHRFSS